MWFIVESGMTIGDIHERLKSPSWCPCCRALASVWHFRDSPKCHEATASVCAMYRASKRKTPPKAGPGRPKGTGAVFGVERKT